ncbi:MAG TPA: hypothetical protein VGM24_04125, partial [Puia sp.]
ANKKFLGKVIEVTGSISGIQKDTGNAGILMDATAMGGVNCGFSKTALPGLQLLKTGDTIRIKGRCTGFLMDVNLVDCVLEK